VQSLHYAQYAQFDEADGGEREVIVNWRYHDKYIAREECTLISPLPISCVIRVIIHDVEVVSSHLRID
jgi:hypothetical protein